MRPGRHLTAHGGGVDEVRARDRRVHFAREAGGGGHIEAQHDHGLRGGRVGVRGGGDGSESGHGLVRVRGRRVVVVHEAHPAGCKGLPLRHGHVHQDRARAVVDGARRGGRGHDEVPRVRELSVHGLPALAQAPEEHLRVVPARVRRVRVRQAKEVGSHHRDARAAPQRPRARLQGRHLGRDVEDELGPALGEALAVHGDPHARLLKVALLVRQGGEADHLRRGDEVRFHATRLHARKVAREVGRRRKVGAAHHHARVRRLGAEGGLDGVHVRQRARVVEGHEARGVERAPRP
mmetsp:Transcript_14483/g.44106  ORF Transcript_14483/g.44106 Transcript_14483/m.44106 type:complete len:293 (-) Transcript_14483:5163-6041(-)